MLSKENRLRGYRIPVILKQGRRVHSEIASLILIPNESQETHIGVIVPIKLSKRAVQRNRTKRLIYEVLRQNWSKMKIGFDIIVMARKLLREEKLSDVEQPIQDLLQKAELLTP